MDNNLTKNIPYELKMDLKRQQLTKNQSKKCFKYDQNKT